MVLGEIFGLKEARKKPVYIFFAAIIYSIIGILCSIILFPDNVGMISIAFISILLLPILNNLLRYKSKTILQKLNLKRIFFEHKDIFVIYTLFFVGIFTIFIIINIVLPTDLSLNFFNPQLQFYGTPIEIVGSKMPFFLEITQHNIKVLLITFILSIMYGAGSMLVLTWNASVWGSVLGFVMNNAISTSQNPFVFLIINIGTILPFLLLESVAYISADIAAGVLAKTTIQEKFFSKRFKYLLTDSLMILTIGIIIVFIAGFLEVLLI